jgi:hypothetical protein
MAGDMLSMLVGGRWNHPGRRSRRSAPTARRRGRADRRWRAAHDLGAGEVATAMGRREDDAAHEGGGSRARSQRLMVASEKRVSRGRCDPAPKASPSIASSGQQAALAAEHEHVAQAGVGAARIGALHRLRQRIPQLPGRVGDRVARVVREEPERVAVAQAIVRDQVVAMSAQRGAVRRRRDAALRYGRSARSRSGRAPSRSPKNAGSCPRSGPAASAAVGSPRPIVAGDLTLSTSGQE